MAAKVGIDEYSLKLSGGGGISIDKRISEPIALQIVKLVMGDKAAATGGSLGTGLHDGATPGDPPTPKAFMAAKRPISDMEKVACLAYYLTHHQATAAFRTNELSKLNVQAAGAKFSNISATARNAAQSSNGYLSSAGGGKKQIAVRGEAVVEALPDRDKVTAALAENPAKKARKKRAAKKKK